MTSGPQHAFRTFSLLKGQPPSRPLQFPSLSSFSTVNSQHRRRRFLALLILPESVSSLFFISTLLPSSTMGLFNRTPNTATTDPATGDAQPRRGLFNREKRVGSAHGHHHHDDGVVNRRPTFGQWIRGTWLDILIMALMGSKLN